MRASQYFRPAIIAGCVALAAAAISVLGAYAGALSPFIDVAGQFALQSTLLAIVLAVLFLASRRVVLAVVSLAIGILGFVAVAPRTPIEACADGSTHRVLFVNIWAANPDIESAADFLARSNADTIIIAEVRDQDFSALGRLRSSYPYSFQCSLARVYCSLYAFSRVPIEIRDGTRHLNLLALTVKYPDGTLDLTGIHLTRPWPFTPPMAQLDQTRLYGEAIARSSGPRLIIGDFNAVTWGGVIRTFSKLDNVKPLPSRGTWRTNFPWPLRLPIDQVLVGPGIACATKTVGPRMSSDHRPVWVDFAFAR